MPQHERLRRPGHQRFERGALIEPKLARERKGLPRGRDVHAAQKLVDRLESLAFARLVADENQLAGQGFENLADFLEIAREGSACHEEVAFARASRPAGDGGVHQPYPVLFQPGGD